MADRVSRMCLSDIGWDHPLVGHPPVDHVPDPESNQVVVKMECIGVCHRDVIDRDGRIGILRLPVVPGHEGVGRVVSVGPDVTDWSVGDRVATMHRDSCGGCEPCKTQSSSLCQQGGHVFGLTEHGTYSDLVCAPQSAFHSVPEGLDTTLAAVLHCTFGTAWRSMVTVGGLRTGERVVVTGANGGVGAAAIQIASRFTPDVTAVIRDDRHRDFVESLGASRVVVCPDGAYHKQVGDIDLVLDCVGTPTFNASLRCLRVGGRVSVVGNIVPDRFELNIGYVIVMGLRILGAGGATRHDMEELLVEHAREPFVASIHQQMALSDADAAQRLVKSGGLHGRIVLRP